MYVHENTTSLTWLQSRISSNVHCYHFTSLVFTSRLPTPPPPPPPPPPLRLGVGPPSISDLLSWNSNSRFGCVLLQFDRDTSLNGRSYNKELLCVNTALASFAESVGLALGLALGSWVKSDWTEVLCSGLVADDNTSCGKPLFMIISKRWRGWFVLFPSHNLVDQTLVKNYKQWLLISYNIYLPFSDREGLHVQLTLPRSARPLCDVFGSTTFIH